MKSSQCSYSVSILILLVVTRLQVIKCNKMEIPKCCGSNELMEVTKFKISQGIYVTATTCNKIIPNYDVMNLTIYDKNNGTAKRKWEDIFTLVPENEIQLNVDRLKVAAHFSLFENGSLYGKLRTDNKSRFHEPGTFCIEQLTRNNPPKIIWVFAFFEKDLTSAENEPPFAMKIAIMSISVVLLLAVLVLNSLLKEKILLVRANISYVLSLILTYGNYLVYYSVKDGTAMECKAFVFLHCFALLSSYCWINIVAVATWEKIRCFLDRKRDSTARVQECTWKKYGIYSLYAWGIPIIYSAVIAASRKMRPPIYYINQNVCDAFYFQNEEILLYVQVPIPVVLLMNIICLFVYVRKLKLHKNDAPKYRVIIKGFAQLTAMMAIFFVLDVVNLLLEFKETSVKYVIIFYILITSMILFYMCATSKAVLKKLFPKRYISSTKSQRRRTRTTNSDNSTHRERTFLNTETDTSRI